MRHAPIRFLAGAALLIAAAGWIVCGCGGGRSEQYRLAGDSYFRLGKYSEALSSYQASEKADPSNARAKLGIGRCYRMQGKDDEALAKFREAIDVDPGNEDSYMEAGNILLSRGAAQEALALIDHYRKADPVRAGILEASILWRSSEKDKALDTLVALEGQYAGRADVLNALGFVHLAMDADAEAERAFRSVLDEIDANSVDARIGLIDLHRKKGDIALLVTEYEALSKGRPEDTGLRLCYAQVLNGTGQAQEAERIVREVMDGGAEAPWAPYVLARSLEEQGTAQDAEAHLRELKGVLPYCAVTGEFEGGVQETKAGAPRAPAAAAPAKRAAPTDWQTLWKQANLGQLLAERERFLAEDADVEVGETLVLAALFVGNAPLGEQLAARLPETSPVSRLVQALRNKDIETIMALPKEWQEESAERRILRQNALGYALAQGGANAQALEAFAMCTRTWPDNAVGLYNMAQVYRVNGMPEFAAAALKRILAQYADNLDIHMLLFRVYRESGKAEEARMVAETADLLFPESSEAAVAVASAYVDAKELRLAKQAIQRRLDESPGDAQLQSAMADVLLAAGEAQAALSVLSQIPVTEETRPALQTRKAMVAALLGDWESVTSHCEPLWPESLPIAGRWLLFSAYVRQGQSEKAVATLANPEGEAPYGGRAGAVALEALGRTAIELSPTEAEMAAALKDRTDALADLAFAVAAQSANLHDAAFAALDRVRGATGPKLWLVQATLISLPRTIRVEEPAEKAWALAETHVDSPAAWLSLAAALDALNDEDGMGKAIDRAAQATPDEALVWFRKGVLLERQERIPEALEAYRRCVELHPEDPAGNNNLAYCILVTGGDAREALERAQTAVKAFPNSPHFLHTLGLAQLRAGELDESRRNLGRALQMRPGDPTMMFDYGRLLVMQDNKDEGMKHIQQSIAYADQLGIDFPRRAEAAQTLEELAAERTGQGT